MTDDRIFTVEQLAKYLQVSPRTIWRWIDEGVVPVLQRGKRGIIRIRLLDVLESLRQEKKLDL